MGACCYLFIFLSSFILPNILPTPQQDAASFTLLSTGSNQAYMHTCMQPPWSALAECSPSRAVCVFPHHCQLSLQRHQQQGWWGWACCPPAARRCRCVPTRCLVVQEL